MCEMITARYYCYVYSTLGVGIAPSLRNILNSLPFKERRWQKMCRRRFHGFHRIQLSGKTLPLRAPRAANRIFMA